MQQNDRSLVNGAGTAESVLVCPYNDIAATKALIQAHGTELAAVRAIKRQLPCCWTGLDYTPFVAVITAINHHHHDSDALSVEQCALKRAPLYFGATLHSGGATLCNGREDIAVRSSPTALPPLHTLSLSSRWLSLRHQPLESIRVVEASNKHPSAPLQQNGAPLSVASRRGSLKPLPPCTQRDDATLSNQPCRSSLWFRGICRTHPTESK